MENYVILNPLAPIGEGSFGRVFKARKVHTGQIVAIKFLKKKYLARGKNEKDLANLRQEIEILKNLRHENIILMLDFFETKTEFCLVTEFGQGELFEILEEEKNLPEDVIRNISKQLVSALHYLHSNRIIHRDMKPQNILISQDGVVKLCDFGFARSMSRNTMVLTSIKGTPLYMSPELVEEHPYNHTVDLWSLGVILYELFVGQPPFFAQNLPSLVKLIVKDTVKFPDNLNPVFKDFLKGLLNKDPRRRLNWPHLLEHPFIQDTEAEKLERLARSEKYNQWVGLNFELMALHPGVVPAVIHEQKSVPAIQPAPKGSEISFDTFDISQPEEGEEAATDRQWLEWVKEASDWSKVPGLRKNTKLLESILKTVQLNVSDLQNIQKLASFSACLRVLCLLASNSAEQSEQTDILRNKTILTGLTSKLKSIIKDKSPNDRVCRFLSSLVAAIALVSKTNFDTNEGVAELFKQGIIPSLMSLLEVAIAKTATVPLLAINICKTFGLLFTKALESPDSSIDFFKGLLEKNTLETLIAITFNDDKTTKLIQVRSTLLAAISLLISPNIGPMKPFPWARDAGSRIGLQNAQDKGEASLISFGHQCLQMVEKNTQWINILADFCEKNPREGLAQLCVIRKIFWQISRQTKENTLALHANAKLQNIMRHFKETIDIEILTALLLLNQQLLKHVGYTQTKDYLISHKRLLSIFDDHSEPNPHIAIAALYQIGLLIQHSDESASYFKPFLSSKTIFTKLSTILSTKPQKIKQFVRRTEGTGWGIAPVGYLDHVFGFLTIFLEKVSTLREEVKLFFVMLNESGLDVKITGLLAYIDQDLYLSPKGLLSYLLFVSDAANLKKFGGTHFTEAVFSVGKFLMQPTFIQLLNGLLSETQYKALKEWPSNLGGGEQGADVLVSHVLRVFQLAFNANVVTTEPERLDTLTKIRNTDLMSILVNLCPLLKQERLTLVFNLITKLINSPEIEKEACEQFHKARGVNLIKRLGLLDTENINFLSDVLAIVCQFCRLSKVYHKVINELDPYTNLKRCILHSDPGIRAKANNLIGHMCRHSDYFYDAIESHDILNLCIQCCSDVDPAARKFACFALGNAAFHNDRLYRSLKPSIGQIIGLLKDKDERTRANASGALGNFARNSGALIPDLMANGALDALFQIAAKDPSLNAKRVALFSLGNLCKYKECKTAVLTNEQLMAATKRIARTLESETDKTYTKYAQRFLQSVSPQSSAPSN